MPNLLDALSAHPLLTPERMAEVRTLASSSSDDRTLAQELIRRELLTAFQVNWLMQGRGRELILGPCILLGRLGEGGMGAVYKARHSRLGRIVALKVIRKERLESESALRRFLREIAAAAQLDHANIVRAIDAECIGDTHCLVMEHVPGMSLSALVKEKGKLSVESACDIVRQACAGLQHAHEKGLIHRDIKPSNLLITPANVVKLLDFGLARFAESDEESVTLTEEGAVMGPPDFMAPEQAEQSHTADIRADLYSLGCTLYFLLTGRVPFPGGSLAQKLRRHMSDEPTPIESLRPDVPSAVARVLRRTLAKRPEERYSTPAELSAALESALRAGAAVPAKAVNEFRALTREAESTGSTIIRTPSIPEKRRRKLPLVVGGLALTSVLVLGGFFLTPPTEKVPRPVSPQPALAPLDQLGDLAIPPHERFPEWQPKQLVAVLGEHQGHHWGPVYCAAYHPDGKRLATGGADQCVRIWDTATMRELAVFPNHQNAVTRLAYSPQGDWLASADASGNVWLWPTAALAAQPRGQRLPLRKREKIFALAAIEGGSRLAALSGSATVVIWAKGEIVNEIRLRGSDSVMAATFDPEGKRLVTGGTDGMVRLWNLAGAKKELTPEWETRCGRLAETLAFSADGSRLAVRSNEGAKVLQWDVTGSTPRPLPTVTNVIAQTAAYAPEGKGMVTSNHSSIHLYDLTGDNPRLRSLQEDVVAHSLAFAPGKLWRMATLSPNGAVRQWEFVEEKITEINPFLGHLGSLASVTFSPDGTALATGGFDHTIRLWYLREGIVVPGPVLTERDAGFFRSLSWSADGKRLAAVGQGGIGWVWQVAPSTPKLLQRISVGGAAYSVSQSKKGDGLVFSGERGAILWWEPVRPTEFTRLDVPPDGRVCYVAISADGRLLAASTDNHNQVWLWDRTEQGWGPRRVLPLPPNIASVGVAVAHDGSALACGGQRCHLWLRGEKGEYGIPRQFAPARGGAFNRVSFSLDGKRLAATTSLGEVYVWRVADGVQEHRWQLPGIVYDVAFAPDGRHLAIANGNSTAYVLRLAER